MKLTKYSVNRFRNNAVQWEVPKEYFEPIFNYLVHGYSPGSFFTALLANDMFSAMARSHPANSVIGLKNLTNWINSLELRNIAWGNYEVVKNWLKTDEAARRVVLEKVGLVYSEQDEILKVLKDEPSVEPFFMN